MSKLIQFPIVGEKDEEVDEDLDWPQWQLDIMESLKPKED